jgi:N-acetylmuramoyl-L-alanine amidase
MGLFSETLTMTKGDLEAAEKFINELEIDILARTIFGEARGESQQGMEAVAHVVLNRVRHAQSKGNQFWWGHDIITVCQKPYQFSCWNPGDPNRPKLMAVTKDNKQFIKCLAIARRAVNGELGHDITNGADHYHTVNVSPFWSKGKIPIAQFGTHVFFRLEK